MAVREHIFHTHGHAATLESNFPISAHFSAWGLSLQPPPGTTRELGGWVHFSLPAPSFLDDTGVRAKRIWVRFSAGSRARIDQLKLYQGDAVLWEPRNLDWTGEPPHWETPFLPTPQSFSRALGLSLLVKLEGSPDADPAGRFLVIYSVAVTVRDNPSATDDEKGSTKSQDVDGVAAAGRLVERGKSRL